MRKTLAAAGLLVALTAGAGAEPTASSVIADLVDVVRALTVDSENRVPHLAFQPDELTETPILPMSEVECAYYLRMRAVDQPGVLADVTRILGELRISIEAILQQEPNAGDATVPIVILTHRVVEASVDKALAGISKLPDIEGAITRIRMESFI